MIIDFNILLRRRDFPLNEGANLGAVGSDLGAVSADLGAALSDLGSSEAEALKAEVSELSTPTTSNSYAFDYEELEKHDSDGEEDSAWIENGKLFFSGCLDANDFGEEIICGKINFKGEAIRGVEFSEFDFSGINFIQLLIDIDAELDVICSRCACKAKKNKSFSERFLLTDRAIENIDSRTESTNVKGTELNSNIDDYDLEDVIILENGKLDVSDLVRSSVMLSFPIRLLCSESCKGLCSKCGADLNERECGCPTFEPDPRLAKLQDYFKKN